MIYLQELNTTAYQEVDESGPNINITAFRPLYIYKLLCQEKQISFKDLNAHLCSHRLIERALTRETLNKYIKTLRLLGCEITRFEEGAQTYYRLDSHPASLDLSPEELRGIQTVIKQLASQPIKSTFNRFFAFVRRITRWQDENDCYLGISHSVIKHEEHSPQLTQQIEAFEKYCAEGQILEIRYPAGEDAVTLFLVEPQEVVYHQKRLLLIGNDPKTNRRVRYDINKIESHRQLPSRVRTQTIKTPVSFKLTGRVARNYRPYPGETILDKGEFLLISNRTDDTGLLLLRLIKYGSQCQIISPTSVREEMKHLIERLLSSLNPPDE